MKIRFLLIGTSLSLIPQTINAQCVATQDCATLGYTETSCSGSSGVKCPFGNKWACFKSESEICNDLGFTLTCTDTNQTGVGKACNGKYYECTCDTGYVWNDSSQTCEYDYKTNCTIGALYYSDGTCSDKLESSKTILGIVIYEKSANQNGWIMAIKPVVTDIYWSTELKDISGLPNYTSESNLTDIQASCTNTNVITTYGNSSTYPAAWAAKNYTEGGKTWCLPSGGLLRTALNNSTNFTKINTGITIAGGTKLGYTNTNGETVWSSSEYAGYSVWVLDANTSGSFGIYINGKINPDSIPSVRPVMAF